MKICHVQEIGRNYKICTNTSVFSGGFPEMRFFYTKNLCKISCESEKRTEKIGFILTQECSPVEIFSGNDFSTLKTNAIFAVFRKLDGKIGFTFPQKCSPVKISNVYQINKMEYQITEY